MTAGVATQAMDLRQCAASIAYYGYLQMTQKDGLLRRWTTWLHRRREYISVETVRTGLPLHSNCPSTTWAANNVADGSNLAQPLCVGTSSGAAQAAAANASSSGAKQPEVPRAFPNAAIAHPPVMCEICHEGFIGKECLLKHCKAKHGNWAEYRKHVFWKAGQEGLQPFQAWEKRAMVHSFAFFQNFSVPSSPTNEWTRRALTDATPRVQKACVVCARIGLCGAPL